MWYSQRCQQQRCTVQREPYVIEWQTLLLLILTYAVFAFGATQAFALNPVFGIVITGIAVAQFSSLQHEVMHGHPFNSPALNEALVFPGLTLTVPYRRFRTLHLAHHHDPHLTDPYDDPESNYFDPAVWNKLSPLAQTVLRANNTLLGRVLIGPILGNALFLNGELALLRKGEPEVLRAWGLHLAGLAVLGAWLVTVGMPIWAYLLAAFIGHAILKIRTFAEHRAHELCRARTVIIEDRGPLSLLFLNNNLHVVHHMHPSVPWYRLPTLYADNRDHYLRRNDGYVYRSYGQLFARHFLRAKDPVPHPLLDSAPERKPAATTMMGCVTD